MKLDINIFESQNLTNTLGSCISIDCISINLFLFFLVQSLQTDVHQHNGITWNQARDKCKPFGLENRVDYLQKSAILDKREFWIGKAIYREPTRWIEIIGMFFFLLWYKIKLYWNNNLTRKLWKYEIRMCVQTESSQFNYVRISFSGMTNRKRSKVDRGTNNTLSLKVYELAVYPLKIFV